MWGAKGSYKCGIRSGTIESFFLSRCKSLMKSQRLDWLKLSVSDNSSSTWAIFGAHAL